MKEMTLDQALAMFERQQRSNNYRELVASAKAHIRAEEKRLKEEAKQCK